MKNPYDVLGVSQDATAAGINQGFNLALMKKKQNPQHSHDDLMTARKQLTSPAQRLAADFTYPVRPRAKRPKSFVWPDTAENISLSEFLPDAYSSL